jgi:hypothetical protein
VTDERGRTTEQVQIACVSHIRYGQNELGMTCASDDDCSMDAPFCIGAGDGAPVCTRRCSASLPRRFEVCAPPPDPE